MVYEFGDFQLHVGPRLLFKNGEQLSLTPKTVATLSVLAARSGEVVSKDELMQRIWPDAVVEESNLAQYLHILRKTLGSTPDGRPIIETLKGRGYRLNAPVRSRTSRSENGHARVAGISTTVTDVDQDRRRSTNVIPFLVGAAIVIVCLGVAFVVAKRTGWIGGGESVKSAPDVIVTPLTSGENVTQTTISHDGKFLVFSDYDGDISRLVLQAVDRSSRSEILPRFAGQIANLSFTPDDTQIYFVVSGVVSGAEGLYRISVKGGAPVRLLETVASPVSFSADGSRMVYVRPSPKHDGGEQIVQASSDGSGETVLLDSREDQKFSPNAALSRNGQFVVFGSITRSFPIVCSLTKLDLNDRSVTPLTDEKWDSCYRVAFTHDDRGIAFVGTRHNDAFSIRRDQVYYLELGASESRRLTGDGNWHDPMSLGMTDADEIVALPLDRISQIWTINSSGDPQTSEQITQGQADGRNGIVPMPEGKIDFLARDGDGFAIFETDADGRNRRRIAGAATMQELRGSADGRFLVFAEQQDDLTQLFRIDRNGGDRRQLTFGKSSKIDSSISPDGRWIIYTDDGGSDKFSLQRIPADGGTPELILNEYCGAPNYSRGGQFVSCFSQDGKIKILSADTGITVGELNPEPSLLRNSGARWTPNDRDIVYRVVKNATTNLWRQSIGGGDPQPLTRFPKGDLYNFSYSPDGTKLYLSRGSQIRNAVLIRGFR